LDNPAEKSRKIKKKALELGFLQAGIARADHLREEKG
jgi:hypothetical protein